MTSAELDVREPAAGFLTLQGSNIIDAASEIATELSKIITERKLFIQIGNKRHVTIEGWTTLGAMLGVFPQTIWTRKIDDGWEARVEVRTVAGAVVGAAESMCGRDEVRWKTADEYALRSMAATRAASKALRLSLGWIVELAGFAATPAEEMPSEAAETKKLNSQRARVRALAAQLDEVQTAEMRTWREEKGIAPIGQATAEELEEIVHRMEELKREEGQ